MARNFLLAALAGLVLGSSAAGSARAAEPNAGEVPTQQEEAPTPQLAPPPGISIIPSPQWRPPTQADGQVPGCPAGKLKPLDLLV